MTVDVHHINIDKIPSLVVVSTDKADQPLPIITYFHGYTSSKEFNLPVAYLLAEAGYRVVLPDSLHHGERAGAITTRERQVSFWDIVLKNIEEIHVIQAYFSSQHLLQAGRFGVAGTSMGGITTAAALTKYEWIDAAAILMGSPKMVEFAKLTLDHFHGTGHEPVSRQEEMALIASLEPLDLSLQPEKLNDRPVLFWHGEADTVVPAGHAKTFYQDVKDTYENDENMRLLLEADRNHKVSRYAVLETVKWFQTHL